MTTKKMVKDLRINDTIWKFSNGEIKEMKVELLSNVKIKLYNSHSTRIELKSGDETSWVVIDQYSYKYFLNEYDALKEQYYWILRQKKNIRSQIVAKTTELSDFQTKLDTLTKQMIETKAQHHEQN